MFQFHTQTDLNHYLALCHIPQMGSKRLWHLLSQFESMEAIFGASMESLKAMGFNETMAAAILKPDYALALQDLAWQDRAPHHRIITLFDEEYPSQLQEIAAKPSVLYASGHLELLRSRQIAIVGSRNPTAGGLMNTRVLASELSLSGFTITSGLALGIDASAHQAALNNQGATIAVLGTGLNQIYPKRHAKLAQQISEQGLLVSEFPVMTQAFAENFPRRNRIISGLSLGVLVVEAALKSGSLITARYAIEQNREVFAVPGAIQNPLSRGAHALIRQGAKLVENVNDIIEEFSGFTLRAISQTPDQSASKLTKKEQQILNLIHHTPMPFDYLVEQSNFSVPELTIILTQLELQGRVQATASGYIHLEQTYETQCA